MPSALFVLDQSGVTARAKVVEGTFIVLPGSKARRLPTPSWKPRNRRRRKELMEEGALVEDDKDSQQYVFVNEVSFSSPSAAASLVLARETNGQTAWKHEGTGQTYAVWEEAPIADAVEAGADDGNGR